MALDESNPASAEARSAFGPASPKATPASFTDFLAPLIVGCALFMEMLDSTVISTALPAIARSMHEDPIRLNLAITSYLLSLAVFIPISGWMADRFGSRTVFRAAIVVFTIGSIFCGLSESLPQLVAARVLQGFGGAMMVPVGRIIVLKTIPKSELVQAMSYLTVPAVLGPVVGPPVGGFIVTYYSWRWIFFINVPISFVGIMLVTKYVQNIREEDVSPLDFRGFVLTGLGLAGLVFGFEMLGRGILPVGVVMTLLVGGAICTGAYVMHARQSRYPIIDLALLKIPTFNTATVGGGLYRMGIGAMPFLMPMLLQLVFGLTPFASGLITFTGAAGALIMKPTAPPIIRRLGFRNVLVWNGIVSSLILMGYALFKPSTPHSLIIATLLIGGFFRSLQFTALGTLAFADVPPTLMSNASSLSSMAQQLSLSLGVATAALLLHVSLHGRSVATLSADDFMLPFVLVGLLGVLSSIIYLWLDPNAGAEVSGRRSSVAIARTVQPAPEAD